MPLELNFAERRVLGVLIEKGFTTPEQYPLTVNSIVVGSNQKSCRDPVSSLDEEGALESLESLRKKGFTVLVRMEGSRVDRWKHRTGEALSLSPKEVAILAELILRGPQTDGELRQHAGRMTPFGDLEEVNQLLLKLSSGQDPLIERLSAPEKRRGAKYAHRFGPSSERVEARGPIGDIATEPGRERGVPEGPPTEEQPAEAPSVVPSAPPAAPQASPAVSNGSIAELQRRIQTLEERVEELEATFVKFLR